MSIDWSDDLATGVDLIDEQHRQIFALYGSFAAAWGGGGLQPNQRSCCLCLRLWNSIVRPILRQKNSL